MTEGATILFTFGVCTLIDALMSRHCELEVQRLSEVHTHEVLVVGCDGHLSKKSIKLLVVGDIYKVTQGMKIPADSIVLEVLSPAYQNSDKGYQQDTLLVNESEVTGIDTV